MPASLGILKSVRSWALVAVVTLAVLYAWHKIASAHQSQEG